MEALECPAEKSVLFKKGRADPLEGFDLVSNLIRAMIDYLFIFKIFLTATCLCVLDGVKPVWRARVNE